MEVEVNLKTPANLRANRMILYLTKRRLPLNISVIIRDGRFFSNALRPFKLNISQNTLYKMIALDLDSINSPYLNLAHIKQIRILFRYIKNNKDKLPEKNWILIKDLILLKKEG